MTMLVPPGAASDPSEWPPSRARSAISQGEATEGRQSTGAGTVHNEESSKIQRKALQYATL
jgi:hypothetical protein